MGMAQCGFAYSIRAGLTPRSRAKDRSAIGGSHVPNGIRDDIFFHCLCETPENHGNSDATGRPFLCVRASREPASAQTPVGRLSGDRTMTMVRMFLSGRTEGGATMANTTGGTDTRRWIIYAVIAIVVLLVLAWLLGMFGGATDTVTTTPPATTEGGTAAPAAPQ